MISPSESCNHIYFDGACLKCGQETPERTIGTYEFSIEELQALYNIFKYYSPAYDDVKGHEVVNRISQIVHSNDMDK